VSVNGSLVTRTGRQPMTQRRSSAAGAYLGEVLWQSVGQNEFH